MRCENNLTRSSSLCLFIVRLSVIPLVTADVDGAPAFSAEFGFDPDPYDLTEFRFSIDWISRGAGMMLEVPTFQYIVKNEAGETIAGYTSTDEPPVKGDVIKLPDIHNWGSAEVLGVTMMLAKHYNMVVLKVRPAGRYRL